MFQEKHLFIWCCILAISEAGLLRVSTRCDISDSECKKEMYQQLLIEAADGDPERNIPSVSPMKLSNVVSKLPKNIKLTLNNGVVTGFKDCKIVDMHTCFKRPTHATLDIICNLEVNGRYTVEVPKCALKELGGEASDSLIRGCGKGKATIRNLHVEINVPYKVESKDDEIYFNVKCMKVTHDDNVKIDFTINDLNVGNEVNSDLITKFLEDHSSDMDIVSPVSEKMEEFFKAVVHNYIAKVPARTLYTDNMARYVVN